MKAAIKSLFLLAFYTLLVSHVCADVVVFNASIASSCPCNFTDPYVWIGGVAPTELDQVYILNVSYVEIVAEENITIQSLTIDASYFSLDVQFNWTVTTNITLRNNTVFEVSGPGSGSAGSLFLVTGSEFSFGGTSNFVVGSKGEQFAVVVHGDTVINVDETGRMDVYGNTAFIWGSVSAYENLNFYTNTTYIANGDGLIGNSAEGTYFTELQVMENSTVSVDGLNCGALILENNAALSVYTNMFNTQVTFLNTSSSLHLLNLTEGSPSLRIFGEGIIEIYSCDNPVGLWFSNDISNNVMHYPTQPGGLIIAGSTELQILNVILELENVVFKNGNEPANVFLTPFNVEIVSLNGYSIFPGRISPTNGDLTLTGYMNITGGLYGENSTITINGVVDFGSEEVMLLSSTNQSFLTTLLINGTISCSTIQIDHPSVLSPFGSAIVRGNVYSSGNVQGTNQQGTTNKGTLTVTGNFTQDISGWITVFGLSADSYQPVISVGGDFTVNTGVYVPKVFFNLSKSQDLSHTARFLFLRVNGSNNMVGNTSNFGKLAYSETNNDTLVIDYRDLHNIYLNNTIITPDKPNNKPNHKDLWIGLSVGLAVVLAAIVGFFVYKRWSARRAGYMPVLGRQTY